MQWALTFLSDATGKAIYSVLPDFIKGGAAVFDRADAASEFRQHVGGAHMVQFDGTCFRTGIRLDQFFDETVEHGWVSTGKE